MKSYSVFRMRDEKKPVLRILVSCMVIYLVLAALAGALWKIVQGDRTILMASASFFVCSLFSAGLYLFYTDEKRLLKNTMYGKTLRMYGEKREIPDGMNRNKQGVQEIMDEIDREALDMVYACGGFALMRDWMVLYQRFSDSYHGKNVVYSLPIHKDDIQKIRWERMENAENSAFLVHLWVSWEPSPELAEACRVARIWRASPYVTKACEQADIQALRQWSASIQETWEV